MDSVDPCFGFNNQLEQRVSILSLDSFTPAFVDPNCTKEETSRRFLTFFLENKAPYSNSMVMRKAYNTLNECVALKSPLFHEDGIKEIKYKETSHEALQRYEEVQTLLTMEEFRSSLAVSHLKGFPRIFGLGNAKGKPIIVREYVEGVTLAATIDLLPHVDLGACIGIEPITVAAIAKAVLKYSSMPNRLRVPSCTAIYHRAISLSEQKEQTFSNKWTPAALIYVSLTWEALRTLKQIPHLLPLNMASGVTEQLSMPHLKCSPAM